MEHFFFMSRVDIWESRSIMMCSKMVSMLSYEVSQIWVAPAQAFQMFKFQTSGIIDLLIRFMLLIFIMSTLS